jgi:hypothetical protein
MQEPLPLTCTGLSDLLPGSRHNDWAGMGNRGVKVGWVNMACGAACDTVPPQLVSVKHCQSSPAVFVVCMYMRRGAVVLANCRRQSSMRIFYFLPGVWLLPM